MVHFLAPGLGWNLLVMLCWWVERCGMFHLKVDLTRATWPTKVGSIFFQVMGHVKLYLCKSMNVAQSTGSRADRSIFNKWYRCEEQITERPGQDLGSAWCDRAKAWLSSLAKLDRCCHKNSLDLKIEPWHNKKSNRRARRLAYQQECQNLCIPWLSNPKLSHPHRQYSTSPHRSWRNQALPWPRRGSPRRKRRPAARSWKKLWESGSRTS